MNTNENTNLNATSKSETVLGKAMNDAGIPGIDEALDSVKTYAQNVNEFIKARPIAVLAAACVIGATVALIASSRSKNADKKVSL